MEGNHGVAGEWPQKCWAAVCLRGQQQCLPQHPVPTAAPGQGCWFLCKPFPWCWGASASGSNAWAPRTPSAIQLFRHPRAVGENVKIYILQAEDWSPFGVVEAQGTLYTWISDLD